MDKDLLELYSDYLLSSFGATTATGLSALVDGAVSHDQVTRFLSAADYDGNMYPVAAGQAAGARHPTGRWGAHRR